MSDEREQCEHGGRCDHNDGERGQQRAPKIDRPPRPEHMSDIPPGVRTVRAMRNRRRVIE